MVEGAMGRWEKVEGEEGEGRGGGKWSRTSLSCGHEVASNARAGKYQKRTRAASVQARNTLQWLIMDSHRLISEAGATVFARTLAISRTLNAVWMGARRGEHLHSSGTARVLPAQGAAAQVARSQGAPAERRVRE